MSRPTVQWESVLRRSGTSRSGAKSREDSCLLIIVFTISVAIRCVYTLSIDRYPPVRHLTVRLSCCARADVRIPPIPFHRQSAIRSSVTVDGRISCWLAVIYKVESYECAA